MKKLARRAAILTIVGISTALASCGRTNSAGERYSDLPAQREEFDEEAATEKAVGELAFETYTSIGAPYGCTEDCEGHEAGFEWAKENHITDGACGGDSQSFIEGCQAYSDAIEEKVQEYRHESEA